MTERFPITMPTPQEAIERPFVSALRHAAALKAARNVGDPEPRPEAAVAPGGPSVKKRVHACLECGEPRSAKGEFCSTGCRTDFNNRRKARGAELHDLYMAHRFDRANAQALGVLQAMNRLASVWREEDKARRAGRRSWRATRDVLDERPYLRSIRGQA